MPTFDVHSYKDGEKAFVFLTSDTFDKNTQIKVQDIMFLAKVTVQKSNWECYYVHLDKVILDLANLLPEGQVSRFAHVWVERGEEAWNLWNNPSNRFVKVE